MRFIRLAIGALLAVALASACGAGSSSTPATTGSTSTTTESAPAGHAATTPAAFAWLKPAPPPPGWSLAHLHGTVALAYPQGWQRIHSDPGSASAAREDPRTGLIIDFLNATPRQGNETLQDWAAFRPAHNRDEGDRDVRALAAAQGLRFRDGVGSCVIDRYRTSRTSYQEIACLVRGSGGETVVVAAALAPRWSRDAPALERAVSAFLA